MLWHEYGGHNLRSVDNFQELVLFFHYVGHWDSPQCVSVGSRVLYLLSRFKGPFSHSFLSLLCCLLTRQETTLRQCWVQIPQLPEHFIFLSFQISQWNSFLLQIHSQIDFVSFIQLTYLYLEFKNYVVLCSFSLSSVLFGVLNSKPIDLVNI